MAEPDKSSDEHESEGQPENSLPEHAEEHEGQPEISQPEHAKEHEDDPVAGAGEMWPGWPGESVFRILVPTQKVGSIIGRKGEYIKKMCEETRARIKILDGPPGTTERAVMISAKEEPDSSLPPAINGLLRVHKRVVDGLDNDSSQAPPLAGGKVSTRLLVPAAQAANLIGKQGVTVKSIKETSNCIVRVIGTDAVPIFALEDDRIVEVVGEPAAVHRAVELVASHLRKFLVDRSIIPIFEVQMQKPISQMEYVPPPMPSWGPPPHPFPPSVTGPAGYGSNSHFAPPPRQNENYYPPLELPPHLEKQPHQGISAYGEASLAVQQSTNNQPVQSLITQVSQQMRVPLTFADAVIGNAGARISYIRRISGATVSIQETRGVPGEMTVEINGTASQVQKAQQLIQNFMGEAAAAQTQTAPPVSQGYNVYAAQSNVYAPAPSNSDLGGQTGGYGSVYGANYGY